MNAEVQPRPLSPIELAGIVKMHREARGWTQEVLAELAGVSARTVQRVEDGRASSSPDVRRALARALELDDIDAFNKSYPIPTSEQLEEQRARFEKERVTLKARLVRAGRDLADIAETCQADMFSEGCNLPREAQELFAHLADHCRDYRDMHDVYSASSKFEVYDYLDELITKLKALDVQLYVAERAVLLRSTPGGTGVKARIAYVVAFDGNHHPENFAVPREVSFG